MGTSQRTIRLATLADLESIVNFQQLMAEETEGKRLDQERVTAGVSAALQDPVKGRYFVAEEGGQVLGSLALTFEWSDWRAGWFWWIQSVFVVAEARRTGIYRALYAAVEAEAKAAGDVCGVRLYVEKDNHGARTTYSNLGMHESHYRLYEIDYVLG